MSHLEYPGEASMLCYIIISIHLPYLHISAHLEYPGEALPAPPHLLPPPAVEDIAAQASTRQHQAQQPGYHGEAGVDR